MTDTTNTDPARHRIPWRVIVWGIAGFVLLLPAIAGAPWTAFDYVAMAVLLGGAGLTMELVVRRSRDIAYRAGCGIAVVAAFLLLWVNGAVGILGDEDNPANLLFVGVIAIAAVGAALARFRAAGMARVMATTAAAQALVGGIALAAGWASPGYAGVYEVALGTGVFSTLWLISAGLFGKAARDRV
ncbi:hypothetical protein [Sphingomonas sp.]|uniref:hypothetical protein n=1 Tax=Sphingomonas sp. TaxID=28214 RepID=UPI002BC4BD48|nr:hypothetical protein [Sphingomonas sp.]HWK35278.1 hypothetical protein [Sphingomonas sp.]